MRVGIVGFGHVGMAMGEIFRGACIFDPVKGIGGKDEINGCFGSFVCVPTPMSSDGSCDTSIVEDVLSWLDTEVIIIRSTVPIGFTDQMAKKTGKSLVFQPEYYGETVAHPFSDLSVRRWISLGGERSAVQKAVKVYQSVYNSDVEIHMSDAKTVELAKYMENCYLATKVIFCNEMYDVARALDIDYNAAREIWLADPRIGRSHTFVYEDDRGFGGSCLPKDLSAMLFQSLQAGCDMTLLKAVKRKNEALRNE